MRKRRRPLKRTLYTLEAHVGDDAEVAEALIPAESEILGTAIDLEGCHLARTRIVQAPGIRVKKSRLDEVDAANADLENSGWIDVDIGGARFTGARLNSVTMTRVVWRECRADLMQLQNSSLKNVRFEQCILRGAFFNGSTLPGTIFDGSDLSGADFSGANIEGCDFRRAIIEDIHVSPDQVRGCIVTSDQALYLARLFGLEIRE